MVADFKISTFEMTYFALRSMYRMDPAQGSKIQTCYRYFVSMFIARAVYICQSCENILNFAKPLH